MNDKPDNPMWAVRVDEPSEPIELVAHSGVCRHCNGIVKMRRNRTTFVLEPDNCRCLLCGQPYHVVIPGGDVDAWEREQWEQKTRKPPFPGG